MTRLSKETYELEFDAPLDGRKVTLPIYSEMLREIATAFIVAELRITRTKLIAIVHANLDKAEDFARLEVRRQHFQARMRELYEQDEPSREAIHRLALYLATHHPKEDNGSDEQVVNSAIKLLEGIAK